MTPSTPTPTHGRPGARASARWPALLLAGALALALSILAATPVLAQSCDPDSEDCPEPPPPSRDEDAGPDDDPLEFVEVEQIARTFLNSRGTESIATEILRIRRTCDRVNENYRLHCLTVELRRTAAAIPASGEYAPVQAALAEATRGLQALVDANADATAPPVRARVGGRPAAPRTPPITAIRPDAVTDVRAEAERLLDEAATVLLRSAGNAARRQAAFQPIAQAIGSTKVLLRSA